MKLLVLAMVGCSATRPDPAPVPPPSELDARFVEAIRAAAPAYASWGRVDERPRPAPTDCAMPASPDGVASRVRLSTATDAPHGDKLYYLWASDRAAYLANRAIAPGFAIVKESFRAEPAPTAASAERVPADLLGAPPPIRTIEQAGRRLITGAPTGLYVMTKLAADAPGTDGGWIYGTIAPDGTVTSAGRVASCMGCHEDATHERLFGLKLDPGA